MMEEPNILKLSGHDESKELEFEEVLWIFKV
jgi:hypothetical protein